MDSRIRRNSGKAVAQQRKHSAVNRQLIQKDQIENDPADGKQTERPAVNGRRRRRFSRHSKNKNCDRERNCEPKQGREVDSNFENTDCTQQDDNRQGSNRGGQRDVMQRIIDLKPSHFFERRIGERKLTDIQFNNMSKPPSLRPQ